MMSSRWPRPSGIIASTTSTPVWRGSVTRSRSMIPGAARSIGSKRSGKTAGPPSNGRPSGSTTRPKSASPTGARTTSPVPCTSKPAAIRSARLSRTAPIRSTSRLTAIARVPPAMTNTSSSSSRPETHHCRHVRAHGVDDADLPLTGPQEDCSGLRAHLGEAALDVLTQRRHGTRAPFSPRRGRRASRTKSSFAESEARRRR